MKACLLLLACVAFASGKISPLDGEWHEGQRFAYVADDSEKLHLVDLESKHAEERKYDPFKNTYLLVYTRNNPKTGDIISGGDLSQLESSNLDLTKPVKFIIHGWNGNWRSSINTVITDAYLKALDVNVVVVDWGEGGSNIYPIAVNRMFGLGEFVASAVDWMVERGLALSDVHIMGFSLGAHAAGIAARNVKAGKIAMVTAFDPALAQWGSNSGRVNKEDADYVEIIHTNGKQLGIMSAIGHNDFYPNGGKMQPGCFVDFACSHSRSFFFFANSIDHQGFMAKQCDSVKDAEKGRCNGPSLHMGGASAKPAMGIFYLETNKKIPYYQG